MHQEDGLMLMSGVVWQKMIGSKGWLRHSISEVVPLCVSVLTIEAKGGTQISMRRS